MSKITNTKDRVFIIAEAGVNHNGSLAMAFKLIDVAVKAGADAVKFQTFKARNVISQFAPKADYQKQTTGKAESQLDMALKLEFPPEHFVQLAAYCRKKNIIFMSTPFDLDSIDVLARMGLKTFKIPSGEITNLPYLRKIGRLRRKVILSTGMSDLNDIRRAVDILVKAGTARKGIALLQCNTEYPTPYEDVNLRAMLTMRQALNLEVGYSDHTKGIEIPLAAIALGARIIEKHFTLDKSLPGPDHQASLSPEELQAMVSAIRHVAQALGSPQKKASPSERKNIVIARKSIVAARDIVKGEIFSPENLTVKRPGSGISPLLWDKIMGRKAARHFKADELIGLK